MKLIKAVFLMGESPSNMIIRLVPDGHFMEMEDDGLPELWNLFDRHLSISDIRGLIVGKTFDVGYDILKESVVIITRYRAINY